MEQHAMTPIDFTTYINARTLKAANALLHVSHCGPCYVDEAVNSAIETHAKFVNDVRPFDMQDDVINDLITASKAVHGICVSRHANKPFIG